MYDWSKDLYEQASPEWLDAVPKNARTVFSVGSGWGSFELELQKRGIAVTALALDSVIGSRAERHGVNTIYGTLEEGLKSLSSHRFDCIMVSHLVHLLPDPENPVRGLFPHALKSGGRLVLRRT